MGAARTPELAGRRAGAALGRVTAHRADALAVGSVQLCQSPTATATMNTSNAKRHVAEHQPGDPPWVGP